jgi:hypothetical protein
MPADDGGRSRRRPRVRGPASVSPLGAVEHRGDRFQQAPRLQAGFGAVVEGPVSLTSGDIGFSMFGLLESGLPL